MSEVVGNPERDYKKSIILEIIKKREEGDREDQKAFAEELLDSDLFNNIPNIGTNVKPLEGKAQKETGGVKERLRRLISGREKTPKELIAYFLKELNRGENINKDGKNAFKNKLGKKKTELLIQFLKGYGYTKKELTYGVDMKPKEPISLSRHNYTLFIEALKAINENINEENTEKT